MPCGCPDAWAGKPSGCSELLAPVRIKGAEALHPFADRRVRPEQRRKAFFLEGVDRVERLRRGRRLEREQLLRLLEADQRIGEAVRGAAEAGGRPVRGELAL